MMCKHFIPSLKTLLLLAFLIQVVALPAQIIREVNPQNVNQFIGDMSAYLGGIMEVSEEQIDNYVSAFFSHGTYDATCTVPRNARKVNEDNNQITYQWQGTPGNTYNIGYLNLITGESGKFETPTTYYSLPIEDGLYLIAIQQNCGIDRGELLLFTEDKIIALEETDDLDCECIYRGIHELQFYAMGISSLSIGEFEKFDIVIEETASEEIIHQIRVKRQCLDCDLFWLNPDCINLDVVNFDNGLSFLTTPDEVGALTFFGGDDGSVELITNINNGYQVLVKECLGRAGDDKLNLQIGSNLVPIATNKYKIAYGGDTIGNTPIFLVNQNGQLLARWATIKAMDGLLDLTPYPPGMYFLSIATSDGPKVEKLIRF